MLTPLTAAKIDAGLLQLEIDQRTGQAPPPGEVSLADLASRAGVSEATILDLQRLALAKLARALRADGLPPHLASLACSLIDDPEQPELF
jgi:hypothetical protein